MRGIQARMEPANHSAAPLLLAMARCMEGGAVKRNRLQGLGFGVLRKP